MAMSFRASHSPHDGLQEVRENQRRIDPLTARLRGEGRFLSWLGFQSLFGISRIIQAKIAAMPNWHNVLFKVTRKQIRNTAFMLGYICVLFEAKKDCDYDTSQL